VEFYNVYLELLLMDYVVFGLYILSSLGSGVQS
jgi:hypothetical protein